MKKINEDFVYSTSPSVGSLSREWTGRSLCIDMILGSLPWYMISRIRTKGWRSKQGTRKSIRKSELINRGRGYASEQLRCTKFHTTCIISTQEICRQPPFIVLGPDNEIRMRDVKAIQSLFIHRTRVQKSVLHTIESSIFLERRVETRYIAKITSAHAWLAASSFSRTTGSLHLQLEYWSKTPAQIELG